jgi:hypothetical protein
MAIRQLTCEKNTHPSEYTVWGSISDVQFTGCLSPPW